MKTFLILLVQLLVSLTFAYDRDDYGDKLNTRMEVLIEESLNEHNNRVVSGLWLDPYTCTYFTQASDLDIDHVVPLKYAHERGALHGVKKGKCNLQTISKTQTT